MNGVTNYLTSAVLNAFALGSLMQWLYIDRAWAHPTRFWTLLMVCTAVLATWQLVKAMQWFRRLGRSIDAVTKVLETSGESGA